MEANIGEYKQIDLFQIPRQHYKYFKKVRFEEVKIQRDEILTKLMKKYGCSIEKVLTMLVMSDPGLPHEK